MDYTVAIPSYERTDTLKSKTLDTLRRTGVPAEKIYVFVADEAQKAKYSAEVPSDLFREIVVAKKGLVNARNFISDYFPEDTPIVQLDDDVSDLVRRTDAGGLEVFTDFPSVITTAFAECRKTGRNLWGIAPVANGFFMKPTVTSDLKFCVGHLWGCLNKRDVRVTMDFKEDYERSLKYAVRDGGVVRINYVAAKTRLGATGGLNTSATARIEANRQICANLIAMFPGLVRPNTRRDGEILLARSVPAGFKMVELTALPPPIPAVVKKAKAPPTPAPATVPAPAVGGAGVPAWHLGRKPKSAVAPKPKKAKGDTEPVARTESEEDDARVEVLPLRHADTETYAKAKEELLAALRAKAIPNIRRSRYRADGKLLVAQRDRVIGNIGRTQCFGFGQTRTTGFDEFAANKKNPRLWKALCAYGNLVVPRGWFYNAVQVNHGVKAKKHIDGSNVGRSVIVGLGDYEGGKLRVFNKEDTDHVAYDVKESPTMFNGALYKHETEDFTGERYTIIFFTQSRRMKLADAETTGL